tara:strand:+ start:1258 stop:1542 length:285 start_codon:yes stop_codon:yes gene_type:complete
MKGDEFWDEFEDGNEDLDRDGLAQLRFEEAEFRIQKAIQMISSVCDNIQISVSWVDPDNEQTQVLHLGEGNVMARLATAQDYIDQYKNYNVGWE